MSFVTDSLKERIPWETREDCKALVFVAAHPREITRLRSWHRERNAATLGLRSPWWPYRAIEWMAGALPAGARVFEYGGGGSTLWLEDRGAVVTVAEHDEAWYEQLAGQIAPQTQLLFRPAMESGTITSVAARGYYDGYVAAIEDQRSDSLDLVIVDGRARVECVRRALPKVRPGGLLLLDDTDRDRYTPAAQLLRTWDRRDFVGLKPGHRLPAKTSVWKRPGTTTTVT